MKALINTAQVYRTIREQTGMYEPTVRVLMYFNYNKEYVTEQQMLDNMMVDFRALNEQNDLKAALAELVASGDIGKMGSVYGFNPHAQIKVDKIKNALEYLSNTSKIL